MPAWTDSELLQALGWATLNSFWQMGLLWSVYVVVNHLFNFSPATKYRLALSGLLCGFAWFVVSFLLYGNNPSSAVTSSAIGVHHSAWQTVMLCAAVAYLSLLLFPTVRLFRNWQAVQAVRRQNGKADWRYRLFVQTIAAQLNIKQKVKLVVSEAITSPLTVGYLKPIILLPVAAMNGLTPLQVEAILLHELSHIRRWDYFFNLVASFIQTVLYFNPFAKAFANAIEAEREACCDATVLQFGYNPHDYASALLQLQKDAAQPVKLALAAAGKGQLLSRIEKIMGMEKKKTFRLMQALPLLLAALCILAFNSVLIIRDAKSGQPMAYAEQTVFNPWGLQPTQPGLHVAPTQELTPVARPTALYSMAAADPVHVEIVNIIATPSEPKAGVSESATGQFMPVDFDESDALLTPEEKLEVSSIVTDAKRALTELQWKEVEKSIADAMTEKEKALAKLEYKQEVNAVNWKAIEQNLKANYEKMDWSAIQQSVDQALAHVRMDSLQTVYQMALTELQNLQRQLNTPAKLKQSALPDVSRQSLNLATQTLRRNLDSLQAIRPAKKIIHL